MKLTPTKIILTLVIILILAAGAYWYFFMRSGTGTTPKTPSAPQTGYTPFGRNVPATGNTGNTGANTPTNTQPTTVSGTQLKVPTLRLLSNTPVGGYGASTTETIITKATRLASSTQTLGTTFVRWVDRGRGNIYEARGDTLDIATLSNTVVPKIYESVWNKNITAFVALALSDQTSVVNGVYAELRSRVLSKILPTASTSTTQNSEQNTPSGSSQTNTAGSLTPFELKGKNLPENIIGYAVSPKKDRLFLMTNESGTGVGYVTKFDGSGAAQIFTTPITQVNVDWPSDNVIAITTKGAADERGYLYFVDPKTGVWKKIVGPLPGLSAKVSTDAKKVFLSVAGNSNNIISSIYDVAQKKGTDAVVRTLADKCIWGNFYKEMVYCGVPSQPVSGTYPDDWYKGTVSFIDKIWQENSTTGEIKLISSIVDTSDRVIDAFSLGLDSKDNFLFFMNKNDLSLWSLDLVSNKQ